MKDLWKDRDWTPMLLGEISKPFDSDEYLYEIKFDGIRALVFASPNNVQIISRNNKNLTYLFPELANISKLVKRNTIFDGEIIAMENNLPSFSKLQERTHLKNKTTITKVMGLNPVIFVCFDILYDQENVLDLPIENRKQLLEKIKENDYFVKSKFIIKNGKKLFKNVQKIGLEGIVAKKMGSEYEINKRSNTWLKIKNFKEDEFIIGGYLENKSKFVVSLVLGEYKNDKLYYVGKVTLGKKNALYKQIKEKAIIKKSPFVAYDNDSVNYIKPVLKCKVNYMERTKTNHLRQPFIK